MKDIPDLFPLYPGQAYADARSLAHVPHRGTLVNPGRVPNEAGVKRNDLEVTDNPLAVMRTDRFEILFSFTGFRCIKYYFKSILIFFKLFIAD